MNTTHLYIINGCGVHNVYINISCYYFVTFATNGSYKGLLGWK
jgi:hypothetical protein